ncbi:MAG: hypothetical protein JXB88_00500 [Spirochaetales bacterium]|nr:hypothetical protein [Spirochaetales bacterium]
MNSLYIKKAAFRIFARASLLAFSSSVMDDSFMIKLSKIEKNVNKRYNALLIFSYYLAVLPYGQKDNYMENKEIKQEHNSAKYLMEGRGTTDCTDCTENPGYSSGIFSP